MRYYSDYIAIYGDVGGDEANIEAMEDVSSELARTEYYWQGLVLDFTFWAWWAWEECY